MKLCEVFSKVVEIIRVLPPELVWMIAEYTAASFEVDIVRTTNRWKYVDDFAAGYMTVDLEKYPNYRYLYVDNPKTKPHVLRTTGSWLLPVITKGNILITCIGGLKPGPVIVAQYVVTPIYGVALHRQDPVPDEQGPVCWIALSHDDQFLCVANVALEQWSFFVFHLASKTVVAKSKSRMKPTFMWNRNAICAMTDAKEDTMTVFEQPRTSDEKTWTSRAIPSMIPPTQPRCAVDAIVIDESRAIMGSPHPRPAIAYAGAIIGQLPVPDNCSGTADLRWIKNGRLLWCTKDTHSEHMVSVVYSLKFLNSMPGQRNSPRSCVPLSRRALPLCAHRRKLRAPTMATESTSLIPAGIPKTVCGVDADVQPTFYVDHQSKLHERTKRVLTEVFSRHVLEAGDVFQASDDWSVALSRKRNNAEQTSLVVMMKLDGTKKAGFIEDKGLLHRVCANGAFVILTPPTAGSVYTLTIARGHSKVWPWKDPTKQVFTLDIGWKVNAVDVDAELKHCAVASEGNHLCVFSLPHTNTERVLTRIAHREFKNGGIAQLHGFVPKPFGSVSSDGDDLIVTVCTPNSPAIHVRLDGSQGFRRTAAYAELGDQDDYDVSRRVFTDLGFFYVRNTVTRFVVMFKGFDRHDQPLLVHSQDRTGRVMLHKHDASVLAGIDIVTTNAAVTEKFELIHIQVKWKLLSARLLCFSGPKRKIETEEEDDKDVKVNEPSHNSTATASGSGGTPAVVSSANASFGSAGAPAIANKSASGSGSEPSIVGKDASASPFVLEFEEHWRDNLGPKLYTDGMQMCVSQMKDNDTFMNYGPMRVSVSEDLTIRAGIVRDGVLFSTHTSNGRQIAQLIQRSLSAAIVIRFQRDHVAIMWASTPDAVQMYAIKPKADQTDDSILEPWVTVFEFPGRFPSYNASEAPIAVVINAESTRMCVGSMFDLNWYDIKREEKGITATYKGRNEFADMAWTPFAFYKSSSSDVIGYDYSSRTIEMKTFTPMPDGKIGVTESKPKIRLPVPESYAAGFRYNNVIVSDDRILVSLWKLESSSADILGALLSDTSLVPVCKVNDVYEKVFVYGSIRPGERFILFAYNELSWKMARVIDRKEPHVATDNDSKNVTEDDKTTLRVVKRVRKFGDTNQAAESAAAEIQRVLHAVDAMAFQFEVGDIVAQYSNPSSVLKPIVDSRLTPRRAILMYQRSYLPATGGSIEISEDLRHTLHFVGGGFTVITRDSDFNVVGQRVDAPSVSNSRPKFYADRFVVFTVLSSKSIAGFATNGFVEYQYVSDPSMQNVVKKVKEVPVVLSTTRENVESIIGKALGLKDFKLNPNGVIEITDAKTNFDLTRCLIHFSYLIRHKTVFRGHVVAHYPSLNYVTSVDATGGGQLDFVPFSNDLFWAPPDTNQPLYRLSEKKDYALPTDEDRPILLDGRLSLMGRASGIVLSWSSSRIRQVFYDNVTPEKVLLDEKTTERNSWAAAGSLERGGTLVIYGSSSAPAVHYFEASSELTGPPRRNRDHMDSKHSSSSASASASGSAVGDSAGLPALMYPPSTLYPSPSAVMPPAVRSSNSLIAAKTDALQQLQTEGGIYDQKALETIGSFLDTSLKLEMKMEGPFERFYGPRRCDGNPFDDHSNKWRLFDSVGDVKILQRDDDDTGSDYAFVAHTIDGSEIVEIRWCEALTVSGLNLLAREASPAKSSTAVISEWKVLPLSGRVEGRIVELSRRWEFKIGKNEWPTWLGIGPVSGDLFFTTTNSNGRRSLGRCNQKNEVSAARFPNVLVQYDSLSFLPGSDDLVRATYFDVTKWGFDVIRLRGNELVELSTAHVKIHNVFQTFVRPDCLILARDASPSELTLVVMPFEASENGIRLSSNTQSIPVHIDSNRFNRGGRDRLFGSALDGGALAVLTSDSNPQWFSLKLNSVKTFGRHVLSVTAPKRHGDDFDGDRKNQTITNEVKKELSNDLSFIPKDLVNLMASYTTPGWKMQKMDTKTSHIFRPLLSMPNSKSLRPSNLDFKLSGTKKGQLYMMDDEFRYVQQNIKPVGEDEWHWVDTEDAIFIIRRLMMETPDAQISISRCAKHRGADIAPGAIVAKEEKAVVIPIHKIGEFLVKQMNEDFKRPGEYQLVLQEEFDRRYKNLVAEMTKIKEEVKTPKTIQFIDADAPTKWSVNRNGLMLSTDGTRLAFYIIAERPYAKWKTFGQLAYVAPYDEYDEKIVTDLNFVVMSFPELKVIRVFERDSYFTARFIDGTRDVIFEYDNLRYFDRDGYSTHKPLFIDKTMRDTIGMLGPSSAIVSFGDAKEIRHAVYGARVSDGALLANIGSFYAHADPIIAGRLEPGYTVMIGSKKPKHSEIGTFEYWGVTDQITLSKRVSSTASKWWKSMATTGGPKQQTNTDTKHTAVASASGSGSNGGGSAGLPAIVGPPATFALGGLSTQPIAPTVPLTLHVSTKPFVDMQSERFVDGTSLDEKRIMAMSYDLTVKIMTNDYQLSCVAVSNTVDCRTIVQKLSTGKMMTKMKMFVISETEMVLLSSGLSDTTMMVYRILPPEDRAPGHILVPSSEPYMIEDEDAYQVESMHVNANKTWMVVRYLQAMLLFRFPPSKTEWTRDIVSQAASSNAGCPVGFVPGSNEFVYLIYNMSNTAVHRVNIPEEWNQKSTRVLLITEPPMLRASWYGSHKSVRKDGVALAIPGEHGSDEMEFKFLSFQEEAKTKDGKLTGVALQPPMQARVAFSLTTIFGSFEDGNLISIGRDLCFGIDALGPVIPQSTTSAAKTAPRRKVRDEKESSSNVKQESASGSGSAGEPAVENVIPATKLAKPPHQSERAVDKPVSADMVVRNALSKGIPNTPRDLIALMTSYTDATWKIVPVTNSSPVRPVLFADFTNLTMSPDLSFGIHRTNQGIWIYEKDAACRVVVGGLQYDRTQVTSDACWNGGVVELLPVANSNKLKVRIIPVSKGRLDTMDAGLIREREFDPVEPYQLWLSAKLQAAQDADAKETSSVAKNIVNTALKRVRYGRLKLSSDGRTMSFGMFCAHVDETLPVRIMAAVVSVADLKCIAMIESDTLWPFVSGSADVIVQNEGGLYRYRASNRYSTAEAIFDPKAILQSAIFGDHSCVLALMNDHGSTDVLELKYSDQTRISLQTQLLGSVQLMGNMSMGSTFLCREQTRSTVSVTYYSVTDSLTLAKRMASTGAYRAAGSDIKTPVTGNGRAEVLQQSLKFTPKLNLVDASSDRPEVGGYALVMQMQYPYVRRASDRSTFDSAKQQEWTIRFPSQLPANATAMMALMMRRKTEEGLVCQYRLGVCELPISKLTSASPITLTFQNVNHETQASLVLTPSLQNTPLVFGPNATEFTEHPHFVQVYDRAHQTANIPPCGPIAQLFRRTHVPYLAGTMTPVWMIVNIRDRNVKTAITDAFLLNALEHTTRWVGYKDAAEWAAANTDERRRYEVLAQVCGFYPWLSRYLYDQTWDRSSKRYEVFEQFSCLREKLDMKTAAGDCEDFSHDMCLVCMALIERDPKSYPKGSPLRRLVRIARCYVPFIVDASIYNGSKTLTHAPKSDSPSGGSTAGVDLHMYVQLIPRHTVQQMLDNGGNRYGIKIWSAPQDKKSPSLPMLSLESTEPCITAEWNADTQARNEFLAAIRRMKTIDHKTAHHREGERTPTRKAWAKMSVHSTKESFMGDQFYRLDLCAYSPLLYRYAGFHHTFMICNASDGKATTYGVDKVKWMQFTKDTTDLAMVPLPSASAEEQASLKQLEDRAPMRLDVKLDTPLPIEYATESKQTGEIFRVFARAVDWTAEDDRLVCASAKADGAYSIIGGTFQRIRIMNDVDVVMYQFVKHSA